MKNARLFVMLGWVALFGGIIACEGADPRKVGEFCLEESDCESGLCYDSKCLNPDGDFDSDGLKNGVEKNITGTDYGVADTDGDGVHDGLEVGLTPSSAKDEDGDGIIDAIESLALTADPDKDCIPDQFDPDNDNPDVDSVKVAAMHCSRDGVCGEFFDKVTASCSAGEPACDYSGIVLWQATEATCDGKDNDCDGKTDEDLAEPDEPECLSEGVCVGQESAIFRICKAGAWQCEYSRIAGFEKVESSCDGVDNNCDGVADEGLINQECFNRNEYGKCAGLTVCTIYEGVMCDGPTPSLERCNAIDDNCNGLTDEGLVGAECVIENEFGQCDGFTVCNMSTGGTECSAATPALEICDTIDNDCNGDTDEGSICDRTSTIKMIVHGALLPPSQLKASGVIPAETGIAPLADATVNFFREYCPETGATDVTPEWVGTTGADGVLAMPLQPGYWCLQVLADGYQTMQSYSVNVPVGAYIPINVVLLLNGMTNTQLSLCGRVVEMSDYVLEVSGGTDEPPVQVPIADALVTLTGVTDQMEIATTKSDVHGYWCMYGLPGLPSDGQVKLTATRDTYLPGGYELLLTPNVIYFETIALSQTDGTETECLFEGFEQTTSTQPWTVVSDMEQSSTWNIMTSGVCVAQGYAMECASPFKNEIDSASPGSLVCPDEVPGNSCIPAAGSLITAHAGSGFAWFGDKATCSYSSGMTTCSDMSTRVAGSFESPWINGMNALTLYMTFMSAWEVESNSPETDVMFIEAQTSPMSETNSWSVVGILKEMTPWTPVPVKRAAAAPGWTSGGVDSAPTWQWYRVDLSSFRNEWFRVRFRFDSVDGVTNYFRGWQIDDVAIRGIGCDQATAN